MRRVIIIPDTRLESVPFAALYDAAARKYLVERVTVAIASSAAALQRRDVPSSTLVATVALPSGEGSGTPALPEAAQELADIAGLYRRATSIPVESATWSALRGAIESADVVHVAGHTESQMNGGEHALMHAGSSGKLERASSRTIAAAPLNHAALLVLAACETLRAPASPETHALGLAASFEAAGVAETIGTLAPLPDRDARRFFRTLHQHLTAGEDAAAALRAAQVAAIHEQPNSGSRAWRSVALLTSRIEVAKG